MVKSNLLDWTSNYGVYYIIIHLTHYKIQVYYFIIRIRC
jgi:hypothetical protein